MRDHSKHILDTLVLILDEFSNEPLFLTAAELTPSTQISCERRSPCCLNQDFYTPFLIFA